MTDNVRQEVFQAGTKDASIRDHLALHTGRLNSFDKMATEVSAMGTTLCQWTGKGGKDKDGKGKDGKNKDGKGKAKAKDDKDKTDPKSKSNKDKKCFYCYKIGHVKADCRKKKRDDEQNSLTSSPVTTTPPGLANVPTSTSSLRQLTVPSHVSDDEIYRPVSVMVDSGAANSGCPSMRKPRLRGHKNHHLDPRLLDKHELTHVVFRSWCRHCEKAGPGKIYIDSSQHTRVGHQRSCWIGCSSRAIKSRMFNYLC